MDILKPYMMWGLLTLAIPVIIHLWNGRKGRTISWAATRFLEENDNVPVRHIQLKDYFLLLLRMLLLGLLVLLFAKLFLKVLDKPEKGTVYHFVQPSNDLFSEFKFELQDAITNGARVLWLDSALSPIDQIDTPPYAQTKAALGLQKAFELASDSLDEIHLYLINSSATLDADYYTTNQTPTIHLTKEVNYSNTSNSIQINDTKILYINELSLLDTRESDHGNAAGSPIQKENFVYFIDTTSPEIRRYAKAGLEAIAAVYEVPFLEGKDQQSADLVFVDKLPTAVQSDKVYWLINAPQQIEYPNVHHLQIRGDREAAALPEIILSHMLIHYGLTNHSVALTEKQMASKFLKSDNPQDSIVANTSEIIWIIFLLTLIAERITANYKQL